MPKKPTPCPDCGQPLSEPQKPCAQLGGQPVWCATCEDGRPAAPAHRPRQGKEARIVRSYRVDPSTAKVIDAEAKRSGESQGQVVDRLAKEI